MHPRIVCQFSCGAASAVATKLALRDYADREIAIINAYIVEEHADNRRFLTDCEAWFGHQIVVLHDDTYGSSAREVWRRRRFIKGHRGAACSAALKRNPLDRWMRRDDVIVLGFTTEEQDRFDRFIDRNPDVAVIVPLIDHGLTKSDCLGVLDRAGIRMPEMYRLGYANANCIGCCKGGEGYWNKIRQDFPDDFEEVAKIEEMIGPGAYLFRDRKTGERRSLRDLPPDAGRFVDETAIECSFFCELAARDIGGAP